MKKSIISLIKLLGTVAALAAMWMTEAQATAILTPGNIPQTGDENILLNTGLIGNPIFGTTNQTGLSVRFTGQVGEILTAPASGQARIEAVDGAFTYLMVDLPTATFTSLILNLDATANGTVDFTTITNTGIESFTNFAVGGSGSNFFTFTTLHGQRFSSIALQADVPLTFADAAQFRIGGALRNSDTPTPSVPDGGETLVLLGGALIGLGMLRKKMYS